MYEVGTQVFVWNYGTSLLAEIDCVRENGTYYDVKYESGRVETFVHRMRIQVYEQLRIA